MIRKKKEWKNCRESRQKKKKRQNVGNFEWEKDKNFGETYSDVLKTLLYVSPKHCYMAIRWVVGTFPLKWNFEWVKDKYLGETYSDVFKTSLYVSPKLHYMLPKIFWTICRVGELSHTVKFWAAKGQKF